MLLRSLCYAVLIILLFFLAWMVGVRIVRHFYKFPIPSMLTELIDNPIRRRIQPPDLMAIQHGIEPGMKVLDVGPGSGRYTFAAARRAGARGRMVAIDIEPKIIDRLLQHARVERVESFEARVADVYALPFENREFDVITMIAVLGEIPTPERALRELHRVLAPSGRLAISELLFDPDYIPQRTLLRMAAGSGFRFERKIDKVFYYSMLFRKA